MQKIPQWKKIMTKVPHYTVNVLYIVIIDTRTALLLHVANLMGLKF